MLQVDTAGSNTKNNTIYNDVISYTLPKTVETRSGEFIEFNFDRIQNAVKRAITYYLDHGCSNESEKQKVLSKEPLVYILIKQKLSDLEGDVVHIEKIQDIVIESLKDIGLDTIAYLYENYRLTKSKERSIFHKRVIKLIDSYLRKNTWEINENANMGYSVQGLNLYLFSKLSEIYWKDVVFKEGLSKHHDSGDFHIHDLYLLAPYCVGWDLKALLEKGFGGVPGKIECYPPKHFDSACGQIVNFLYTLQGESAGAVSFSNVDTYLAPFLERDGLLKKRYDLLQSMQKFLHNLSVDTRVGFQCLSEDTEIYTTNGWKTYDQVTINDTIYVFNMDKNEIITAELEGLNIYRYNGTMIRFYNDDVDELVTPTHKTIIKDANTNNYTLKDALVIANFNQPFISLYATVTDDGNGNYDIEFKETNIANIGYEHEYNGIVWCPTTVYGTVIARRNGKIFITGNSPFTNFTLDLECPEHMKNESIIMDGKYITNSSYGEYQKGMDAFNDAFCEIMMKGDKNNKVFTFPIPTYCIDENFDWDNPKLEKLWKMTGKYGIPYFANYINSNMKKDDARSMCCRLSLDLTQLRKRGGGLFGADSLTGSLGVVTINLSRLGHVSKNETDFLDRLDILVEKAHEVLRKKADFVEKQSELGMYPFSRYYLSDIKKRFNRYWANHFLTIGVVAMHEACLNMFGVGIDDPTGYQFAIDVMDFLYNKCLELQEKYGYLTNLEATPAEGVSYKLCQKDRELYPDMRCFKMEDKSFYTNSTHLPVNTNKDLWSALEHQEILQSKYTGGTVFHGYLGQSINDYRVVKNIIKTVLTNFKIPYFNLTPTFSICDDHGYISGNVNKCPKCGKDTLIYSRVVGYLRPVQQWNIGKQEEFKMRTTYEKSI